MKIGAWEASLDLYAILGVSSSATTQRIRASYRRLIFDAHPDARRPSERPFAETRAKRINLAATILLDPTARARYDVLRAARLAATRPVTAASRKAGTAGTAGAQPRESDFWPFTQPRAGTSAEAADPIVIPTVRRFNGFMATALLAAGFVLGFAMLSWLAAPLEAPTASNYASPT